MNCKQCGADLDGFDVGAYRKLVCKEAKAFLCRDCLAKELGWERRYLDEVIEEYRRRGCTLFPALKSDET